MTARTDAANIDTAVRRLCAVRPPSSPHREVEFLKRFRVSVVAEALVRQRVLLRGLREIRTCDDTFADRIDDQAIVRWRGPVVRGARGGFNAAVDCLDQVARKLGISIWLTRGAASIARSGQGTLRDLGDIDLMVLAVTQGYALAAALGDPLRVGIVVADRQYSTRSKTSNDLEWLPTYQRPLMPT